jgi:hypothetical protein
MIDLRGIAQGLLDDIEAQKKDLHQVAIGVKLLYERIVEATSKAADGSVPVGTPEAGSEPDSSAIQDSGDSTGGAGS